MIQVLGFTVLRRAGVAQWVACLTLNRETKTLSQASIVSFSKKLNNPHCLVLAGSRKLFELNKVEFLI